MTNQPPDTVAANMAVLCESIGWDTLIGVNDGRFKVLHDDDDTIIGLAIRADGNHNVNVVKTVDGYSVGRQRGPLKPYWVHGLQDYELPHAVVRCAVVQYAWPPTEEEPW